MEQNFSVAEEIKKIKELLDSGAITQEEFDRKKASLLDPKPVPTQFVIAPPSKPKKKKHPFLIAFLIIFVVFCVLLGSLVANTPTTSTSSTSSLISETSNNESSVLEEPAAPVSDLELIDYTSESDGYTNYVVGHIKNNTDKTYSYVQVDINLYSGDTQVGSTLDNVNNLAPGATWEFKAVVLENNADKFEIVNISGF